MQIRSQTPFIKKGVTTQWVYGKTTMSDNFELGEDEMSLRQAWPFLRITWSLGRASQNMRAFVFIKQIHVFYPQMVYFSTKVEVQIIQCAYIFTCHQTDVCEQRLGSPEAVTIATAGCPSAVRATVLYKSKSPQDSLKKLTPLKSNVSIAWGKEWCKEDSPVRWVSSWRASGWDQERITERVP